MLIADKNSFFGFIEAGHLVLVGRPLGGLLTSVQCWFLNQIADFATARFVTFFLSLLFMGLLYQFFNRHYRLEPFWSMIIAFGILLLPSHQTYILWIGNFIPGIYNLLLAMISYILLERSDTGFPSLKNKNMRSIALLLGAFLTFLMSLLIYPSTSLFVFVFTLSKIVFSPLSQWKETRLIVIRDVLFFSICMLLYWVVNQHIIYPLAAKSGLFAPVITPEYEMNITLNPMEKIPLWTYITIISAAGPWHLLWGKLGVLIPVILFSSCIFTYLYLAHIEKSRTHLSLPISHSVQILLSCIIIFFLSNLPVFIAKADIKNIIGYRMLLPGSAIMLVLQFGLLRKFDQYLQEKCPTFLIKSIAIILISSFGILTFWNVKDAVRNFSRELTFIRTKMATVNCAEARKYIVVGIPRGESLLERKLPFEFGWMITDPQHAGPIIWEERNQIIPVFYSDPSIGHLVTKKFNNEKNVCLINLNDLRFQTSPSKSIF